MQTENEENMGCRGMHCTLRGKTAGMKWAAGAGAILMIFLYVAFSTLISGGGAGSSATVTITAIVPPIVNVNPTEYSIDLNIDPSAKGKSTTMTRTVMVKANTEWNLAVKDLNPVTQGDLTEWTGTGWGEKKLSKPLMVVSANKALKIDKGEASSVQTGGMTGEQGQEVVLTFVQELSPKDKPLPEGRTYRIVLDLEGVPAEGKITGQKPNSGMNQLEEKQ